jgi:hypothetical protein
MMMVSDLLPILGGRILDFRANSSAILRISERNRPPNCLLLFMATQMLLRCLPTKSQVSKTLGPQRVESVLSEGD